jgi:16S rRNA (guanine966-N2)-methyltransferase
MNNHTGKHSLRIIGGNWRGRKVSFTNNDEIRPTPDRVRETLFNWLHGHTHGAQCLELYAGSGILSLEALSRGAVKVVLIDKMKQTIDHLSELFVNFPVPREQYQLLNLPASNWLDEQHPQKFDIVFVDPPFTSNELELILKQLASGDLLAPGALIYIESAEALLQCNLPNQWEIHRQKKAASVHYCLCRVIF